MDSESTFGARKQGPPVSGYDDYSWQFVTEVLQLPSPWTASQSSFLRKSTGGSIPLTYESGSVYISALKPLIIQECKATILSGYTQLQRAQKKMSENSYWTRESNCQGPLTSLGVLFLAHKKGPKDVEEGDLLLLSNREMKGSLVLAVAGKLSINLDNAYLETTVLSGNEELVDYQGILVSRVTNLVTLRRSYVALHCVPRLPRYIQMCLYQSHGGILPANASPMENLEEELNFATKNAGLPRAWLNMTGLNLEQQFSIACALGVKSGIFSIHGPPGTGKTSTITGIVAGLLYINKRCKEELQPAPSIRRILLCSPSNAALDEIVLRMQDHVGEGLIVRLGADHAINPHVRVKAPFENSARHKAICQAEIVCATLSGSAMEMFNFANSASKFDIVLIDEAGQAVEAETLIPLQHLKEPGRLILVGDPKQLPATVFQSPSQAYERSLFERLQQAGCTVQMLTRQYRMRPAISKFPNRHFYNNLLVNAGQGERLTFGKGPTRQGVECNGYRLNLGAYRFLDVQQGRDVQESASSSRFNVEEGNVTMAALGALRVTLKEKLDSLSVGIITPYAAQCRLLAMRLRADGWPEEQCEVSTVDGFQGREVDILLLSCVRASERGGIGFLSDARRLNVALTRARQCLLLIGNSHVLQTASLLWRELIADAKARHAYVAVECVAPSEHRSEAKVVAKEKRKWGARRVVGVDG